MSGTTSAICHADGSFKKKLIVGAAIQAIPNSGPAQLQNRTHLGGL